MIGPTDKDTLRVMVAAADRQPPLCEGQWTVTGPHDETRHANAGAAWEAALALFEDSDVDRVVMTDTAGRVAYTVTATDTDGEEECRGRACTLCGCDATGERHGFPVCTYHYDHGEDDPPCPACEAGGAPDEPTPDSWVCPECMETGCVHSREPHEGYC